MHRLTNPLPSSQIRHARPRPQSTSIRNSRKTENSTHRERPQRRQPRRLRTSQNAPQQIHLRPRRRLAQSRHGCRIPPQPQYLHLLELASSNTRSIPSRFTRCHRRDSLQRHDPPSKHSRRNHAAHKRILPNEPSHGRLYRRVIPHNMRPMAL